MAIYDIYGNELSSVYDIEGHELDNAYDIEGNLVYTKEPITLKAMTYNVGQWWYGSGANVPAEKDEMYYALQNGIIQNANADVLFLNEYRDEFSGTGRTALSLLEQYYPYIETRSGGSGLYIGRAICSKYPLAQYVTHTYSGANYYDSATITVDGIPITAIVTHLSTNKTNRLAQLQTLISFLNNQNRFICCGDLNSAVGGSEQTTGASDYRDMIVPLLNEGFNLANCSDYGFLVTYTDGSWSGCLDNIITSSNISINSAHVDTTKLTDDITDRVDHMPLIAELEIN